MSRGRAAERTAHPSVVGRDGMSVLTQLREQPKLCGSCSRPSEAPLCRSCDAELAAELGPRRRPGGRRA